MHKDELGLDELEQLMQESPVGENHGFTRFTDGEKAGGSTHRRPLNSSEQAVGEFLSTRETMGWLPVDTSRGTGTGGAVDAGMTAHRGVLHPAEYVHAGSLERMLEERLGVSLQEFDAAYRSRGRPTAQVEATRVKVDAVLLEVVEGGGNVEELASILGVARARIYDAAERARLRA